jgi:hypothetical protein
MAKRRGAATHHADAEALPARTQLDDRLQMNSPEAYIHFTAGLIRPAGEVTNDKTAEFLRNYMVELHAFIVRVLTVHPRTA